MKSHLRKWGVRPLLACGVLLTGSVTARAQNAPPARDPLTGVVRSRRLEAGLPLGGIGTGGFQLMTDGTVSRAVLTNNWNQPTGDLDGCFAALWTRSADRTTAQVLALKNAYRLPAVSRLDFTGLYPQATLAYPDPALPLSVTARAFSPLVPHDLRNSSFPAACFVFVLKNTSPVPVECSVALAWESMLGVGGTATRGPFQNRTGNTVAPIPSADGYFGLSFARPQTPGVAGDILQTNARGDMALMTYPPRAQALVTTAAWNALDRRPAWWDGFAREGRVADEVAAGKEGTIHPAGVVAVKLTLRPGDLVEIPFALSWNTPQFYTLSGAEHSHYYARLFRDSPASARKLLTDWRILLSLTTEWQNRILFSNLPRWLARRLINAASPLTTHTLHTREGHFAFLANTGRWKETSADTRQAAALAPLLERLSVSGLLLAFFPQLDAQELSQFAAEQRVDGRLPPSLGNLDYALRPQPFIAESAGPDVQGAIPDARNTVWPTAEELDGICAYVIQVAEYVFWTGDSAYLLRYTPTVRRAVDYLLRCCGEDRLPRLVPTPENVLSPLRRMGGVELTPTSALLWTAALRAGQRLAEMTAKEVLTEPAEPDSAAGPPEAMEALVKALLEQQENVRFVKRCAQALPLAADAIRGRWWAGEFFAENLKEGVSIVECVSSADQLLGMWAQAQMGLPAAAPILELFTDKTLANLPKLHSEGKGREFGPVLRTRINGLLPPNDPEAGDSEPFATVLGMALLAIRRGQPETGLAQLQRLDDTRNNVLRAPWQSPPRFRADTGQNVFPELGSLSQAADWNALSALQGVTFNLDEGALTLSPRIPGSWRKFNAPLFAPTFWGTLEYKPLARGCSLIFRLERLIALQPATPSRRVARSAELTLRTLRIPGASLRQTENAPLPTVLISRGFNPLGARISRDPSGDLLLTFDTPLVLTAGDRLEVTVREQN